LPHRLDRIVAMDAELLGDQVGENGARPAPVVDDGDRNDALVDHLHLETAARLPRTIIRLAVPNAAVMATQVSLGLIELYFLAIGCASLRYDWRICAMSGALAVTEYSGIVAYAWRFYGAGAQPAFGWNVQVGRVIVLIAAALISVAAVLRAQRLRLLSITDRLTGATNRGFFDQRLAEEESRARRYGHAFAIAIVDVDHFKRFNDTYGHVAGDGALQTLAETLKSSMRKSDVVARYGGEEFALILPETGLEEAAHKIELIRRLVTAA